MIKKQLKVMSLFYPSASFRYLGLFFLLAGASFRLEAQEAPAKQITVAPATLPLEQAFEQIGQKAGVQFVYSQLDSYRSRTVSFRPATATVTGLLNQLQRQLPISFSVQGSHIAVRILPAATLSGTIRGDNGEPVPHATVYLQPTGASTKSDSEGRFSFRMVAVGEYTLQIRSLGHEPTEHRATVQQGGTDVAVTLAVANLALSQVEVFGERNAQPDKLDAITRLPLKPADQIQSISVISHKVIRQQGNLTVRDAVQNVAGVYTFATYSDTKESLASRGFRGIPTLKNGVRVYEDGLGQGFITDMEGVESIQVLKGSNAITQGLSADIGNSGGVVNVVTKTPKFEQSGYVSFRAGSWGLARPAFDVQGLVNETGTLAFRVNGAVERRDSYRKGISGQKMYINPSLAWKPDAKTTIIAELDYLNDGRTPDAGTVNLAGNDSNAIYDLPYDRFLGFEKDRYQTKNLTYALRFNRELSQVLNLRVAYFSSALRTNNQGILLSAVNTGGPNLRARSIIGSTVENTNTALQIDLIGKELYTGTIKHTFQVGMDYKTAFISSSLPSNNLQRIDTIDVFGPISNKLPAGRSFLWNQTPAVNVHNAAYGILAQHVVTFNPYLEAILGVRYSTSESESNAAYGATRASAWNPQLGLIVTPWDGFRVFGSYTSNTGINGATIIDRDGNHLERSRYDQFEAGLKTEWLQNRLRFNLTLYQINNKNLPMRIYEGNVATPFYEKGGNDERKGIEAEITGRPIPELDIIAGYAYIDAKYKDHTSFYFNSAPLNTPKHTYNFYANYEIRRGTLQGLSAGAGIYHVGERPVNDWSRVVDAVHGTQPGVKPFNMDAVTTVNLQAAYAFSSSWDLRLLANNLFNSIGYNAYRTSYIHQTDPRNFSAVLTYRF